MPDPPLGAGDPVVTETVQATIFSEFSFCQGSRLIRQINKVLSENEKCYKEPEYRLTAVSAFGICPHCGSSNVIKKGTRGGKQRLICNDCHTGFTCPMPK